MNYERLEDIPKIYPGGVAAIARDTKLSVHGVYRVLRADHAQRPEKQLRAMQAALRRRKIAGRSLLDVWTTDRARRLEQLAARAGSP
jgi:hypothetical protein